MVQVNNCGSVDATKVLRVEAFLEFIQSNFHQVRGVVCVYLDVIIGADQAGDVSNSDMNHPTATIADEQAKQILGWFRLKRLQRPFANRGFTGFGWVN